MWIFKARKRCLALSAFTKESRAGSPRRQHLNSGQEEAAPHPPAPSAQLPALGGRDRQSGFSVPYSSLEATLWSCDLSLSLWVCLQLTPPTAVALGNSPTLKPGNLGSSLSHFALTEKPFPCPHPQSETKPTLPLPASPCRAAAGIQKRLCKKGSVNKSAH